MMVVVMMMVERYHRVLRHAFTCESKDNGGGSNCGRNSRSVGYVVKRRR